MWYLCRIRLGGGWVGVGGSVGGWVGGEKMRLQAPSSFMTVPALCLSLSPSLPLSRSLPPSLNPSLTHTHTHSLSLVFSFSRSQGNTLAHGAIAVAGRH